MSASEAGSVVEDGLELGEETCVQREELTDHLLQLLAGDRVQRELGLLRLGEEGGVRQRGLEGLAEDLDPLRGSSGRQDERAGEGGAVLGPTWISRRASSVLARLIAKGTF